MFYLGLSGIAVASASYLVLKQNSTFQHDNYEIINVETLADIRFFEIVWKFTFYGQNQNVMFLNYLNFENCQGAKSN